MLIITGTGGRVAEAYNGDPNGAPLLHIEYRVNEPTIVDAGDDQQINLPTNNVNLDGTVTNEEIIILKR